MTIPVEILRQMFYTLIQLNSILKFKIGGVSESKPFNQESRHIISVPIQLYSKPN